MLYVVLAYAALVAALIDIFLIALFRSGPQAPPRDDDPWEATIEELRNTVGIGRCPVCGERYLSGTFAENGEALAWCENAHTWVVILS